MGRRLEFLNYDVFMSLKIAFILANSADPDEMPHHVPKYNKTCVKQPLSKRQKIGFQVQLSLNAEKKNHLKIPSAFVLCCKLSFSNII